MSDQFLDSLDLGSARGGKKPGAEVEISVVRSLTEDDLPMLVNPPALGSKLPPLVALRHSHHQLARLLASSTTDVEASLITGYSPAYISNLKRDPAFQQLLASYSENQSAVFVDVLERMKALGLSTLDELQARLENSEEEWSRRELMELAELMLIKPQRGGMGGQNSGPTTAVALNVKFVTAEPKASASLTIEHSEGEGE